MILYRIRKIVMGIILLGTIILCTGCPPDYELIGCSEHTLKESASLVPSQNTHKINDLSSQIVTSLSQFFKNIDQPFSFPSFPDM